MHRVSLASPPPGSHPHARRGALLRPTASPFFASLGSGGPFRLSRSAPAYRLTSGIRLRGRQLRTAFQTWMHRVSLASPPPGSHPHAMRGAPASPSGVLSHARRGAPAPPYGVAVL